ncbi:A24 family peptidase [Stappia indica]|uniref:A24 family peptidase n=1 Tax=Stappia indica TaxID=538381 RepID=UPI001CD51596|nr:prepilin peptidase [Stappia indica]MCA1300796.1 prepilin peptidase [Stappia indica]
MLEAALLVVFPCLVAYAGMSDLFTMTIPNRVSLLLIAGFAILAPFIGLTLTDIGLHLLMGAMVLVLCFGCFAMGWMGGGDAKIATAVGLWFGLSPAMLEFAVFASVYGGVLTLAIVYFRGVDYLPPILHNQRWVLQLHETSRGIPYGVALALAALQAYPHSVWFAAL